jgi:hypothetical protein
VENVQQMRIPRRSPERLNCTNDGRLDGREASFDAFRSTLAGNVFICSDSHDSSIGDMEARSLDSLHLACVKSKITATMTAKKERARRCLHLSQSTLKGCFRDRVLLGRP